MNKNANYLIIMFLLIIPVISSSQTPDSTFNQDMIQQAEELIGLEFTDANRDSMLNGLQEQRDSYQSIRNVTLSNAIPPAMQFNPIPLDFEIPSGNDQIKWTSYVGTQLPDDQDDLAFYSVGQLAELIRTRQITSVELTRYFLKRLHQYDPILHCVITFTDSLALVQARRADDEIANGHYLGPLHGIPWGVKDLLSVRNYKTTWGAMPFKDQMIPDDAAVVQKLEAAGAVLVAKLTMGALAWGDVWYGETTRNPWNSEQGSSGSSAGSASAVSAGLVPFAIGTETWGSIVSPSTVCGVTGLRPTYGRVSRRGAMALSWSMDKIGPIGRTVEDCAMVFDAIHGGDRLDQTLIKAPFYYNPKVNLSELKIGFIKQDFDSDYPFHEQDSVALSEMKKLGANLNPIELPDLPVNDLGIILTAEAGAAFDQLTRNGQDDMMVRQVQNAWPNVFRQSRFIPAVEYINANRLRYVLIQEMHEIMQEVDLFMAPSWQGNTLLITNLTGHPCVVVPNGFDDEGMPTSITFIGQLLDEGRLMAVAKQYQDATGWHLKHPVLE